MSSSEITVQQESSQSNSKIGCTSKCHDTVDVDDFVPVTKRCKLENDKSEIYV